jgi:beta-phosphoglucomutase-like phosphatase (HAD superfamily)
LFLRARALSLVYQAGKAAGMSVLVKKSTYTKNDDFRMADHVVHHLKSARIDLTTLEVSVSLHYQLYY